MAYGPSSRTLAAAAAICALAVAACSPTAQPTTTASPPAAPTTQPPSTTSTSTTTTAAPLPPSTTTTVPPVDDFDLASAAVLHHSDLPDDLSSFLPAYAEVMESYTWLFEHGEWEVFAEGFAPAGTADTTDIEWADTAILPLPTVEAALDRFHEGVNAASADEWWGLESEFDVGGIGLEAAGLVFHQSYDATEDYEGEEWFETQVVFVSDRFLGMVTISHALPNDYTALAIDLASRLELRLRGVLAGTIEVAERPDGYFALAWIPNRRLDAFTVTFNLEFEGDFPGTPLALHGTGAALGQDFAECSFTVPDPGLSTPNRIVLFEGEHYFDAGDVYETLTLGHAMHDMVYLCPVFVEFWQESRLDEESLRWDLDLDFDPSIVELGGRPTRHYDLSDHAAATDSTFTQGLGDIARFEIWYPVDDVWPLRVSVEASGDVSALLGPGYATSGDLEFDVRYTIEVTPADPADVSIVAPNVIRSGDPST